MSTGNKLAEIQRTLEELSDSSRKKQQERYFKTGPGEYGEGDKFRGIRVPVARKVAKQYAEIPLEIVKQLLHSDYHEDRLVALLILVAQFQKMPEEERKTLFNMYLENTRFINNWDLVDTSSEHIVGAFLMDRDKTILKTLAASDDLWERRIAMLSTFHYIKKHEFDDALMIADLLWQDSEDLIHKAVGWMLREIGKRDLTTEESFLKTRYKNMPRTMLRYAIEKFPEEKRQAYLRGRI